jgi:hypothetical protein
MGQCHYCSGEGPKRVGIEDGIEEDLYACEQCWELLKNPATALQLIRGDLSIELRGTMGESTAKNVIDRFMGTISEWGPVKRD